MALGDLCVLFGNGDGTFQPPSNLGLLEYSVFSVLVADFDGDGKLDILFVGQQYELYVMLGNGNGTFQAPSLSYYSFNLTVPDPPPSLAPGDFNGDGKPDLVFSAYYEPEQFVSQQAGLAGVR